MGFPHPWPAFDRLNNRLPDIICGDGHGSTLDRGTATAITGFLQECGLSVSWNHPYAGGFITRGFGDAHSARQAVQIELNPFTLVGATTRSGLLTAPLRARFGINLRLQYYDAKTLTDIVERSAGILDMPIEHAAAYEIASRSRGTPRIANALLRRVRDFAEIKGDGTIDQKITEFALDALNVDRKGLDEMDNRILTALIDKFNGGPVGASTIATAIGENPGTLEEVYEPYLIQEGLLVRTPRGRQATAAAYAHLGRTPQGQSGTLFGG